jgi:hypothetical protein
VGSSCRLLEKKVLDPRDHVYGFLGFQRDPKIAISPDYNLCAEAVFTGTTEVIIAETESLNVFSALRLPSILLGEGDNLPSWVPDWSLRRWFYPLCKTAYGNYIPYSMLREAVSIHR